MGIIGKFFLAFRITQFRFTSNIILLYAITIIMLFAFEKLKCKQHKVTRVSLKHLCYSTASPC